MYGYMYMWPFEGRGKIDEEANGGSNSDGLFVTGELRPCKDGKLDYRIGWTSFIHLIGYVIFIVTESGLNVVRGLMQLFWGIMLSSINFKAFVYDLQHVYLKKKNHTIFTTWYCMLTFPWRLSGFFLMYHMVWDACYLVKLLVLNVLCFISLYFLFFKAYTLHQLAVSHCTTLYTRYSKMSKRHLSSLQFHQSSLHILAWHLENKNVFFIPIWLLII